MSKHTPNYMRAENERLRAQDELRYAGAQGPVLTYIAELDDAIAGLRSPSAEGAEPSTSFGHFLKSFDAGKAAPPAHPDALVVAGDALLERLKYAKCPTCAGSGTMTTGRPNGDDHWTQKDAKGRDIPVGGGGGAMRMGTAPCTTCELIATVKANWDLAKASHPQKAGGYRMSREMIAGEARRFVLEQTKTHPDWAAGKKLVASITAFMEWLTPSPVAPSVDEQESERRIRPYLSDQWDADGSHPALHLLRDYALRSKPAEPDKNA